MRELTTKMIRRYLPAQLRVDGTDGTMARINLRDADMSYDRGDATGVERLEIITANGDKTVLYGMEFLPGRMPADLRSYEHRAGTCHLRWMNGMECQLRVSGHGGALGELYNLMVIGLKPKENQDDE